jgi:hypothetical protein
MCIGLASATGLSTSTLLGAVSVAGQGLGTLMSLQAQKQALAYDQMQSRMLEQQYKDQATAIELQTIQSVLDRKNKYLTQLSENRALMAGSGIDIDSPSYRAFFKANEKIYKQDVGAIKLMGTEERLSALREAQQAQLSGKAAQVSYKAGVASTVGRSLLNIGDTAREFMV